MQWSFVAIYTCAVFCLSGCFLSQSEPSTPQPQLEKAFGIVAMEDVDATEPSAGLFAKFSLDVETRGESIALNPRVSRLASAAGADIRGNDCLVSSQAIKRQTARAAATLLDAGELSYGPALQSTLIPLPRGTDGTYVKELSAGIPSGLYQVVGAGSRAVAKFEEYLSMPEPLSEVMAGGFVLKNGNIQIRQSSGMEISWAEPTVPNERNLILVEILTQTDTVLDRLSCLYEEAALTSTSGRRSLTIPATELSRIHHSSFARFDLIRAHLSKSKWQSLTVMTQGVRAVSGMGELAEN